MMTKRWAREMKHMSKSKNDMICFGAVWMNVYLLIKFCINEEVLWLLVSQAAVFSWPPWPVSTPSLANSSYPLLGPVPPGMAPVRVGHAMLRCISSLSIFSHCHFHIHPSSDPALTQSWILAPYHFSSFKIDF